MLQRALIRLFAIYYIPPHVTCKKLIIPNKISRSATLISLALFLPFFLSFSHARGNELPYFIARRTRSVLFSITKSRRCMLGPETPAVTSQFVSFVSLASSRICSRGSDRLSNLHEDHVTLLQSGRRSGLFVGWVQGQCQWVSRANRVAAWPKASAEFAQ